MDNENQWFRWALDLQNIAQTGLYFGTGKFDLERYEKIRGIAASMISALSDQPVEKIVDMFCSDTGYVTPKLDTRAAVCKEDRILLVQEESGLWCLPGGWVEADCSIMENAVKEVKEEAGLTVRAERLIALQDLDKNNLKLHPFKVIKAFVLCKKVEGHFQENAETVDSGYFGMEDLPELAVDKTTKDQIAMCLQANQKRHWETIFD